MGMHQPVIRSEEERTAIRQKLDEVCDLLLGRMEVIIMLGETRQFPRAAVADCAALHSLYMSETFAIAMEALNETR